MWILNGFNPVVCNVCDFVDFGEGLYNHQLLQPLIGPVGAGQGRENRRVEGQVSDPCSYPAQDNDIISEVWRMRCAVVLPQQRDGPRLQVPGDPRTLKFNLGRSRLLGACERGLPTQEAEMATDHVIKHAPRELDIQQDTQDIGLRPGSA